MEIKATKAREIWIKWPKWQYKGNFYVICMDLSFHALLPENAIAGGLF